MRRLFVTVFALSFLFTATPAISGPGHDHGHSHDPVSSETAGKRAAKKVAQLAEKGKIDSSWSGLAAASVEKKTFSKGPEWVITFKNDKVSDKSKQTLYLFYSLDGNYIAANYTGN